MTAPPPVDHHVAAAALDRLEEAIAAAHDASVKRDAAVRDALATPGVTQQQVAARLGISARALRKRLPR